MRFQRNPMSIQGKTMRVQGKIMHIRKRTMRVQRKNEYSRKDIVFKDKQSNVVKMDETKRKIIIFETGKIFEYSMWAKNRNFSAQIKT